MKNILICCIVFLIGLGLTGYLFRAKIVSYFFAPRQKAVSNTSSSKNTQPKSKDSKDSKDIEIIAQNLDIPWEIAFLPSNEMLVTERSGKLLKIGSETKVIKEIEGVKHIGEGGLLGLAIHPNFSRNNFIYIYLTSEDSDGITNRVERYKFSDDTLSEKNIILEGIKGSSNHDGGRIAFGPDGYLYITTGDAEDSNLAQDKNSLNGKILRVTDDGSIPADNPFGNAVYSLGHRNPQGLAWDQNKTLWETEHGPSGPQTGYDEVNIIVKGANYGWPIIKGDQLGDGYVSPVIQSGADDTWAPAGMTYWNGSLFFVGLRGEALYQAKIEAGNRLDLTTHLKETYGRLRAITLGDGGYLYLSTSNTDGRGREKEGDDIIIKIDPKTL